MAEAGLPSGLVTFLFTDIEGSTRLFSDLGDRYVDVLDRHSGKKAWSQSRLLGSEGPSTCGKSSRSSTARGS